MRSGCQFPSCKSIPFIMKLSQFNQSLINFLDASPTPFHAVKNMVSTLREHGFTELLETDAWNLEKGKGYWVTRNDSSIIAFTYQGEAAIEHGVRMMGAHTDSPCLRVKPTPEIYQKGYLQLGVEVYGGVLLNPWFDRDLSLAGRVTLIDDQGTMRSVLVDFKRPVLTIPSLAIHLNREVNNSKSVNPQTELPAIMMQLVGDEKPTLRAVLKTELEKNEPELKIRKIQDYELSLYDVQGAALVGLHEEFLASARLDNLLSCFIGLQSLLTAKPGQSCLLVCNDHEEVGSMSAEGAMGPMLDTVLQRMYPNVEDRSRCLKRSMIVSADNAHGVHPNYVACHDGNHGPILNKGPVIKVNNNQRYATNSETSSLYKHLSEELGLPCQTFVVRTDMACGSTIGPLTAGQLGVKTLDIGVPQFAMHSIREMVGTQDAYTLFQVLARYCELTSVSFS